MPLVAKKKAPKKPVSPTKMDFLAFFGVKFTAEEKQASWRDKYILTRGKAEAALLGLNDLGADGSKLNDMIVRAQGKAEANDPDYEGACAELKDYKATAKKAEKEALKTLKASDREKVYEANFQAQKERMERRIEKLRALPGTRELVAQVEEKIKAADLKVGATTDGKFEAAFKNLEKADKEAKKGQRKAEEVGGKLKSPVKEAYKEAMTAVERYREYAPDATADAERDEANDALQPVLDAANKKGINKTARKKIQADQARTLQEQGARLDQECDELLKGVVHECEVADAEVGEVIPKMVGLGALEAVIGVKQARDKAHALITRKDWEAARDVLVPLAKTAAEALATTEKDHGDWESKGLPLAKKIKEDLEKMKETAVTDEGKPFEVFHKKANALIEEVDALVEGIKTQPNFADALSAMQGYAAQVKKLEETVLTPFTGQDMKQARKTAELALGPLLGQVNTKKDTVLEKVQKVDPGVKSLGSLDKLDAILADWRQARDAAVSQPELDKAREAALQALRDLSKRLDEASTGEKSDAMVNDVVKDVKTQEARKKYEGARDKAQTELNKLMPYGGDSYEKLLEAFRAALRTAANQQFDEATQSIEEVERNARGMLEKTKADVQREAQKAGELADELAQAIEKQKSKTDSLFADFFTELVQELDDLRTLCKVDESGDKPSGNLSAINLAVEQMKGLQARLEKLKTANDSKKNKDGTDGKSFKEVLVKLKELNKQLSGAKNVQKCMPSIFEDLTTQWQTISDEAKTAEPEVSWPKLEEFEKTLTAQLAPALARKNLRLRFKRGYKVLQVDVKKAGVKKRAPRYYKQLSAKMKSLETKAKTEDGERDALKGLAKLRKQFGNLLKKDPNAQQLYLVKRDGEARTKDDEEARAKEKWEKITFPNYEKDVYAPTVQAIKGDPEGDATQLQGLKALAKQAQQLAKSGQYEGAEKVLEQARELAESIQKEPQGFKKTARKNLGGMDQRWADAVAAFIKDVDALAEAAKTWCDNRTPPDERGQRLGDVRALDRLFDPVAFQHPISVLADTKTDRGARKAVREDALRTFRRYLNSLLRDPVLNVAQENPFVPLRGSSSNLLKVLKDIEFNVLTCV